MGRVFVTNRPNYCHRRFAESVGCKFYHVKHFIPENIPLLSLPVNGFLNSLMLEDSDVFFAESIMDYYPVYWKNTNAKKIILIAEDTLFKMESMNAAKRNFLAGMFRSADGFLAVSDLCRRMLLKYVKAPVRVAYPFPHREFFRVSADVKSRNILFVGRNDKTKGFVELVEAVRMLRKDDKEWNLFLVGECSRAVEPEEGIRPLGFVKDMAPYFRKCAYYVHPAYFDPCPATVFEAMNAGMITVISRNIGQTEIFRRNRLDGLILPDNKPQTIARKLSELDQKNKSGISGKLRTISRHFRERERVRAFRNEFESLLGELE